MRNESNTNPLLILAGLVFVAVILSVQAGALSVERGGIYYASPGSTIGIPTNFTAGSNENVSLDFSVGGANASWVVLAADHKEVRDGEKFMLDALITIPTSAEQGVASFKINYHGTSKQGNSTSSINGSETYLVVIQAGQSGGSASECAIVNYPDSYGRTVTQGVTKTKQVTTYVSTKCNGPVTIQSVSLSGDIVTGPEGHEKPLEVAESNTGPVMPGQSVSTPIAINTKGLATGSYDAVLTVAARSSDGRLLAATTHFTIDVTATQSAMPANMSAMAADIFVTFPSNLVVGSSYQVIVNHVPAGADIVVEPNDMLEGEEVSTTGDSWVWTFKPVKSGRTKIRLWLSFKGAPIGKVKEGDVRVGTATQAMSGVKIRIKYYPDKPLITPGKVVRILALDANTSAVIEDASIFIDGQKVNGPVIFNDSLSHDIIVQANGYEPATDTIIPVLRKIHLLFTPEEPEAGEPVMISSGVANATITVDGDLYTENESFTVGNHTVKAYASGFEDYSGVFHVKSALKVVHAPEKLEKGVEETILLSRPAHWQVIYQQTPQSLPSVLAEGGNTTIRFVPTGVGSYSMEAEGKQLWSMRLEKKLISKWVWISIVIAAISVFLLYILLSGGAGGSSTPYTLGEVSKEV